MASTMLVALVVALGVSCGAGEDADVSFEIKYLNEPALLNATKASLENFYGQLIAHESNDKHNDTVVTSTTGVVGNATVSPGTTLLNQEAKVGNVTVDNATVYTTLVSAIVTLDGSTVAQVKDLLNTDDCLAKILGGLESKVPIASAARDAFNHVELGAITVVSRTQPPPAPPVAASPAPVVTPAPEAGWPWWGTVLIVIGVLACLAVIAVAVIMNSGGKKKPKSTRATSKKAKAAPAPPPPAVPEAQPLYGNMHEFAVTINEHPIHMGQPVTYQQPMAYPQQPVYSGSYAMPVQSMPMIHTMQPAPHIVHTMQPANAGSVMMPAQMVQTMQPADAGFPMEPTTYQPMPMQSGSYMMPAGGSVSMAQPVHTNMSPVPVYTQVPQ